MISKRFVNYLPPLEGVVSNGALGTFDRTNVGAVGVFQPLCPRQSEKKGNTILVAGANSDHTSVGYLARYLVENGQGVKVVAIPGYDHDDPGALLLGSGLHARDLAAYWIDSVTDVVRKLVKESLRESAGTPLFLGGFSLGAALSLTAFASLRSEEKQEISVLILGTPAYTYSSLVGAFGWFNGSLLAVNSFRGTLRKPKPRPKIPEEVKYLAQRPWSSEQAAVNVSKWTQRDLAKLEGRRDNPRVLLIHGGDSDETISIDSADLIHDTFGEKVQEQILSSGHWVFAGADREQSAERTLRFIQDAS